MNFIWTTHSLERLKERKIPNLLAEQTLNNPDKTYFDNGATKYEKTFDKQVATGVVKTNDQGEQIVVSFWIDPPNPGTKDFKKQERFLNRTKAGPFKKMYLTFLDQIGL